MAFGFIEILLTIAFIATCFYGFRLFSKKPQGFGQSAPNSQAKKNEVKEEKKSGGVPMTIFYGSQSGTAEGFAEEMRTEARAYGFDAKCVDLEDYDNEDLADEKFALYLMATFGEGEPTDNAVPFWEWITESDTEIDLQDHKFGVFGLGNRQYEHFCTIGIKLDELLGKFGGQRVCKHGEGDDDGSLDEDFEAWRKIFWPAARKAHGLPEIEAQAFKFETSFKYEVVETDYRNASGRYADYSTNRAMRQDPKHGPIFAPITVSRELCQDTSDGSSTLHVEVDIAKIPQLRYRTADNCGICPQNNTREAMRLLKRLGGHPNSLFTMKKPGKFMYPIPCSMKDAFSYFVDFNNTPRFGVLQTLSQYASDPAEKAALEAIASSAQPEARKAFVDEKLSLLEIIERYSSVNPPLHDFLEFCPKLQPRYYTIASSALKKPKSIAMTIKVLKDEKPGGREFKGVATHHVAGIRPGKDELPVFVRTSTFRLPRKVSEVPIIMCGPGTGIAPFKGFVQEFMHLKEESGTIVDATLYFGCQRRDKDFLYQEELEEAEAAGVLKLHCAFSREQKHKVYVQDLLRENGEETWEAINDKGAYVYVCGATTMGKAIRELLVEIASTHGKLSASAAEEYVSKLQKNQRFIQELWS